MARVMTNLEKINALQEILVVRLKEKSEFVGTNNFDELNRQNRCVNNVMKTMLKVALKLNKEDLEKLQCKA